MIRLFTALLLAPALCIAQAGGTVRGTVRDSAFREPLAGAVILVLDSAGATLARNVSRAAGEFQLTLPPLAARLRVIRLGFRPREVPLPRSGNADAIDVDLTQLPRLLETIVAMDQPNCPRRPDRAMAFALWEQARLGLLASVVARETHPASIVILRFQRALAKAGVRIEEMNVWHDSIGNARASFSAMRTATDFLRKGFVRDSAGQKLFMGPDADVLLDPQFVAGYCMSVAQADSGRPDQVGLRFARAQRERGRVDIDGILWLDTLARSLRDLEFRYVGMDEVAERMRPGGTVVFAEMPTGTSMIERWSLRMIGAELDTLTKRRVVHVEPGNWGGAGPDRRVTWYVTESGGELARAVWPGTAWQARLGTLRMRAVDESGRPAPRVIVLLEGTTYRAVTDSVGRADINDLVPGPYTIVVADSTMAQLGATILTRGTFVAARDSTVNDLVTVSTAESFAAAACRATRLSFAEGSARIAVRAMTADGKPVKDARVEIRRGESEVIAEGGRTGSDGFFFWCKGLATGDSVEVRVWRRGELPTKSRQRLAFTLTPIKATLPPAGAMAAEFSGTVVAEGSEQPVIAAEVVFLDVGRRAFTDSAGRFRIAEIPAGEHQATVRKIGFGAATVQATFTPGQTVLRRVILPRIVILDTISVRATMFDQVMREFEDNRRIGLGKFWTREQLEKVQGMPTSSLLSQIAGSKIMTSSRGNYAWIARNRGVISLGGTSRSSPRLDDFDARRGAKPACYADVWLDNMKMYSGRDGEPLFDVNSILPSQIETMEYYANAAQTPARYSNLNSVCGVLVIWTRRSP